MQRPVVFLTATLVAVAVAVPAAASENVLDSSKLCKRLCRDGLGGKLCGCDPKAIGKEMSQDMYIWRTSHPEEHVIKGPRWGVCMVLCHLGLGQPLCGCEIRNSSLEAAERQREVCNLCELATNGDEIYSKLKCDSNQCSKPGPQKKTIPNEIGEIDLVDGPFSFQFLQTMVDWNLWCIIQCEEGDGGIACDCDMLPLQFENKKLMQIN
ncbi:uncharacterized protein LOC135947762 [Cloeon dipterum]|uniref:uncharacterized protein LOC135947762 n=1 Tax=Cloeon dipterum TaxID=197152 RepID=UPI00321FDAAC